MAIIDILGVDFNTINISQAVDRCMEIIQGGERGYPVPVNVNIIMQMRTNESVRKYVEGASLIVADGLPLVWLSRLWYKTPLPERIAGVALMEALIKRAAKDNVPVYFLGSTSAVMQTLIETMREQFPKLKIAGHSDGYFSEEED